jgi:hypothetical protein
MTQYKGILKKKKYTAKVRVYNVVTSCDPATVTATNSASTVIGTTTAPSGGTGNIPIPNSVISNTTGVINNLPATTPLTVIDSVVSLVNTANDPLSTTNVPATTNLTLTAPNSTTNVEDQLGNPLGQVTGISGATNTQTVTVPPPPVCDTLDELVDSSTNQQVRDAIVLAGKECAQLRFGLDSFGNTSDANNYVFAVTEGFGTVSTASRGCSIDGNVLYATDGSNVRLFNATTNAPIAVVGGFSNACKVVCTDIYWIVTNFGTNQVYVMNKSDNSLHSTINTTATPYGITLDPTNTIIYVSSFASGAGVFKYNLATGAQIGVAITGFDTQVLDIVTVGTEWWVLTSVGTGAANTQRIRKMSFATDTQTSNHPLGTVATIGAVRALALIGARVFVTTAFINMVGAREYDSTITLIRDRNIPLNRENHFGLANNPNNCNSLTATFGTAQLISKLAV